jgi:uncharacterized repeat protein (TIGR01451 family)/fimbrial isopeptide formation D2 family protein
LLNVPTEVLIGEPFTFTVVFENTGSVGYGPFIDLVLEAGGEDRNTGYDPITGLAPGPCDGIRVLSAELVDINPVPLALTVLPSPDGCSAADCLANPCPGPLGHPYPEIIHGNPSPAAPINIGGLLGAELVTIELPFGSYDSNPPASQPKIVVEVTALVHECATAVFPLEIRARGGFRYGATPDNVPNVDHPVVSADGDIANWVSGSVVPKPFVLKKEYLGPEDEAVAGPNFTGYYPLTYRITVDVAEGQLLKGLTVTDNLSSGLWYADSLHVSVYDPTNIQVGYAEPSGGPGGTLQVQFYDPVIGQPATSDEVVITFDFYVPDGVLDKDCANSPTLIANDVWAGCDWYPFDQYRDSACPIVSDETPADHTLQAKCMAIQKSVKMAVDVGEPGLTPGDTLEYTLRFQVSDYHTIGTLEIFDHLSDGQRLTLLPAAPQLTIQDWFDTSYTVGFPAGTPSQTPNPGADCTCCCCSAVGDVHGVTDLVFDVSSALTAGLPTSAPQRLRAGILTGGLATSPASATPASGTLVFYVQVTDEFFVNGSIPPFPFPGDKYVDKDDPINNCVEILGYVLENDPDPYVVPQNIIGRAVDDSHTCVILVSGVLAKSVYAVNGSLWVGGIPDVLPGDDVTFRLQYTIPSGDAEMLEIRDWLPLPVFDVSDPTAACGGPTTWIFASPQPSLGLCCPLYPIPGPGEGRCGPTHSELVNNPGVTVFVGPSPNVPLPGNSLEFLYWLPESPYDVNNTPKTIDYLFTLRVTCEPFADGLYLTNEAQECEENTFGVQFCQTAIAQVHVREPELSIKKGVIATDNPHGQFGVYDPATGIFTPGSSPTSSANLPPSNCPRVPLSYGNPITSTSLGGFIDRDLRNVDAGDWVTFAIAVENSGGAPAYQIELADAIPLDAVDGLCCFKPDFDGLCVTNGAGVPIPFTTAPGGQGRIIIKLGAPLDPGDPANPTGTNIAIITFDAQLLDVSQLQSGCCSNKTELLRYTSCAQTCVSQPNFVDAGFGGPFEDTAWICVGPRAYAKCIEATSELHTVPQTAGSAFTYPSNTVDAAVGEIIRFRLITVIPEGTTLDFQIRDLLPTGLTYIGNPRVAFVANVGIGTTPPRFWRVVSGDETTHGSCPGPGIAPPGTTPDVATTPFVFGTGQDPIFFVESPTLPAPYFDVHILDSDPELELVIIEFNAQVDNIQSNQNGTLLANRFEVAWGAGQCCSKLLSSLSDPVYVRVVEPELTMTKTASPTSTQPNGTVTYTVTIAHDTTSTADAFEVTFIDPLPTDLTPVPGVSCSGCLGCTCGSLGQNIIATCPRLNQGDTMTITYQAKVDGNVQCNPPTTLTNTATVTWTSLPVNGTPPGPLNHTGQSTVGASGDPDGERDGSDGVPPPVVLNDYQAKASATITVECCPCVHPLPPKMAAWWPLDETTGLAVHDIIGSHDGTAMPGPISAGGPKSSVDWPSPSFLPKGMVDNALFFYGGRYIGVPHSSDLDPSTGPFSVDAWVVYSHVSSPSVGGFVIATKGTSTGWTLYIDPTADLLLCRLAASGNQWTMQADITPGVWQHVALAIDRGTSTATITLYVDGVPTSWTGSMASGFNFSSNQPLYIGGDGAGTPYEMAVDEVELFQYALTLSDVQGIFGAGSAGKCKPDLGDAPDSSNHAGASMLAYALPVVLAHFPTVYDPNLPGNAPLGPIHWLAKDLAWLGVDVSLEGEADTGWDQELNTLGNNIQPMLNINNKDVDDGVTSVALQSPFSCGQTSVTFSATNALSTQQAQVYINVWFDWTHDGDWDDTPDTGDCLAGVLPVPEWAVQNHIVTLNPGLNSALMTPPFLFLTPLPGQTVWMRITLTDVLVSAIDNGGPFPSLADLGKGGSGPVGGYCYGETEDYLWQAKGPATPCVQAPADMVAWWPADGNADDIAGRNSGTLQGGAGYVPGMVGQAFSFVAAGDGVEVRDAGNLNFGAAASAGADLSIDAWIATSSTARVLSIVDKRSGASGSQATGYTLFLYEGRLAFQLGDGTFFNYISPSSLPDLRDGAWHHVAVTVDRTSAIGGSLYVDGAVVLTFDPTNRPGSLTNREPLFIGRHAASPGATFIGRIDEVEIFSRVLTAGEVEAIFTAGSSGKCK